MHGIERSVAYVRDNLPALGEVGKAVGERAMQIQTDEMRWAMGETGGVVPRRCDAPRTVRHTDANPKDARTPRRCISPEPKASREAVATGVRLAASV